MSGWSPGRCIVLLGAPLGTMSRLFSGPRFLCPPLFVALCRGVFPRVPVVICVWCVAFAALLGAGVYLHDWGVLHFSRSLPGVFFSFARNIPLAGVSLSLHGGGEGNVAEWLGRLCIGSPVPDVLSHVRPCADCRAALHAGGVTKMKGN